MDKSLKKISKFLSYALRHNPAAAGITLDARGWTEITALIAASDGRLTHDLIEQVVAGNDKQRFAISDDGLRIRANQGHSVTVDLGLEPVEPPEWLYHGTAVKSLDGIRADGLVPGTRQHVHLSGDPDTANRVGQRHGKPVVLRIPAKDLHQHGHAFYRAANGVWLTDALPAEALVFPDPD